MIEIRLGDEGKKLWDRRHREWVKIIKVDTTRKCEVTLERENTDIDYCYLSGCSSTWDKEPDFVWEETTPMEFRKRPKEKKKIDLWVGIGEQYKDCHDIMYKTTNAVLNKNSLSKYKHGIHKITIEIESEDT